MQKESKLYLGDCLEIMPQLETDSIDAIVTDPPYGISFMGKDWDKAVPSIAIWQECLRVLKPGAFAFVMCIPRQDCLARMICRLEDAGFDIGFSSIYWTYACLSEDTEVLTQYGWMKWERLRKNLFMYKILIYNYEEDKYYFEEPEKWSAYRIRDTIIRIKSDFTDQCVTRNHRVFIEREGKLLCIPAERLSFKESIPVVENVFNMRKNGFPRSWIWRTFSNSLFNGMWKKGYFKSKQWKETNTYKENRNRMPYMRKTSITSRKRNKPFKTSLLFPRVLCNLAFKKRGDMQTPQKDRCARTSKLDRSIMGVIPKKDEWRKQSRMERGCNIFQKAWQLWKCKICTLPKRIFKHGTQRRICNGAPLISSATIRKAVMAIGNGASYRSRSNKQQSGELNAIPRQSRPQTARRRKSYRTTLATITEEDYEGVVFCPTVSTGCFIARRKGKIFITGNSGFPKAQNLSKQADKRAGVEREIIGDYKHPDGIKRNYTEHTKMAGTVFAGKVDKYNEAGRPITIPTTEQARALEGAYSGMQLKPAVEIVIVAMKPLSEKTYLDQAIVNKHGCTWLDECRIPYKNNNDREINIKKFAKEYGDKKTGTAIFTGMDGGKGREIREKRFLVKSREGRFPANVLCEDDVLNDGNTRKSGNGIKNSIRDDYYSNTFQINRSYSAPSNGGDTGSFSRYFSLDAWFAERIKQLPKEAQKTFPFLVIPKASKSEKNRGLEGESNIHPTIKPIKLMSWLITLASREGDIILDPFCGSGTTLIAAKMLSRQYIGIELEKEYYNIARLRIDEAQQNIDKFL